jgi:hypothetical protein
MNANELADKLQELDSKLHLIELFKSATMLRQQQAEIANLKHMNLNWQISENILLLELEKLQHRELTDEEIDELANKYLYVLNDVPYANDIKDFARAILRKAQEK